MTNIVCPKCGGTRWKTVIKDKEYACRKCLETPKIQQTPVQVPVQTPPKSTPWVEQSQVTDAVSIALS